jgi:hypothetical protein
MHRVTTAMFKPSDLFDLADWQFRDIFDRLDYAWAALPLIHDYVLKLVNHTGARKPDLPGVRYLGEEIFIPTPWWNPMSISRRPPMWTVAWRSAPAPLSAAMR